MENEINPLIMSIGSEESNTNSSSVYERIRHDILSGYLHADVRLKISELAVRHGTSTNPVREALQQLRGEGLVLFSPNQGARVRAIDIDFVRDLNEVAVQIEPYLLRWFVETASLSDVKELENIQDCIEKLDFTDKKMHSDLDEKFHQVMYSRHYNRVAYNLWQQNRRILVSISTRVPIAIGRREAIIQQHQQLISCIRVQDVERAAQLLSTHITDAGRHLIDQLRVEKLRTS